MKLFKEISNRLLSIAFVSSLIITGTSCSDDDNNSGTNNLWDISGNTVVSIKPERYKLQRNPLQGWVIYGGIGDGMMMNFWDLYDNFESSEGQVRVADYGTTIYIRGAWSDFNPEEGVYIWQDGVDTKPAQRFRMLVNGAKERGLKLAFTFVTDSRDKHYNFTPEYVKEAGAQGFETTTGSVKVWSPYPDDPIFQEKYEQFLTDFAAKYNNPDEVQFVSGFGLGKWGETHTLKYSTGDDTPRYAVTEWISSLMARLFTKVPIVINYHRCIMSGKEYDNSGLEESENLINLCVNKGFSLRHDAFGMKTYYSNWERGYAATQRFNRPFIMEGGWVESSHGGSIKGDGYANFAEVRQGEFDEAKGANVNMMDLRFDSNVNSGETHSWFNTAFNLVKKFIAEGGYRLYPDKVSVPTSVTTGGKVSITHRWSNLGWGYCPTNIPQWNQKYKVAFALLDKTTEQPVYTFVNEEPRLCDWVHGSPKTYNYQFSLTGVNSGEYIWAVGLVDTTKDNAIGIEISAKDGLTDEGWLKLTDVTVR